MKLEQSFRVAAPIERVWDALVDIERVAPCLPGAAVTGRNQDGTYAGTLTVKIGPTTASYAGKLEMTEVDEGARAATMRAHGTDRRGQGGASATINSTLASVDGGTHVAVSTDYRITGRLARFGRGGTIEDITNRLLSEFAGCLQASLAGEPGAAAPAAAAPAPSDGDAPAAAAAPVPSPSEADARAPAPAPLPSKGDAPAATPAPLPSEGDAPAPAAAPLPSEGDARAPAAAPLPSEGDARAPAAARSGAAQAARGPSLGAAPETQPVHAVPLVASVVRDRVRETPAPLVPLLLGFLLAIVMLRRRPRR